MKSGIDRDLQAICLKCLERQPTTRYASAEALAQDLDRWLTGHAIVARSITPLERSWRWCKRNRFAASMLILVCGALLIAVASLLSGYYTARAARDDAIAQRQTALSNLRAVLAEINDLENRRPDLDDMRLEMLTRIQTQLEPMLDDPVHGTLADETNFWLLLDAGDVYKGRGDSKKALQLFTRALHVAEDLDAASPPMKARLLSFAYSRIGDIECLLSDPASALDHFRKSLAIREELLDGTPQSKADLAMSHMKLASTLIPLANFARTPAYLDEAIDHATAANELYRELIVEEPGSPWHQRFLAYSHESLANALSDQGEFQEAIDQCHQGLAGIEQGKLRLPQYKLILDLHCAHILDVLARCYLFCGRYSESMDAAARAIAIRRGFLENAPDNIGFRRSLVYDMDIMAQSQSGMGNFQDAVKTVEEALATFNQTQALMGPAGVHAHDGGWMMDHLLFSAYASSVSDDELIRLLNWRMQWQEQQCVSYPDSTTPVCRLVDMWLEFYLVHLLSNDKQAASHDWNKALELSEELPIDEQTEHAREKIAKLASLHLAERQDLPDVLRALVEDTESDAILMRLIDKCRLLDLEDLCLQASMKLFRLSRFHVQRSFSLRAIQSVVETSSDQDVREEAQRLAASIQAAID